MTPHSLQVIHASLQSLPLAMSVSTRVMLMTKSSPKTENAKGNGEFTPLDVRATKLTCVLSQIHGYDHSGLNE
jgi:hypothetical protein